jgi:hypothetical protein
LAGIAEGEGDLTLSSQHQSLVSFSFARSSSVHCGDIAIVWLSRVLGTISRQLIQDVVEDQTSFDPTNGRSDASPEFICSLAAREFGILKYS